MSIRSRASNGPRDVLLVLAMLVLAAGCGQDAPDETPDGNAPPGDGELVLVAFNVESGDANPLALAEQIAEVRGEALWGLSEVEGQEWAEIFRSAAERGEDSEFRTLLGTTGGADRLALLYDERRLEYRRHFELHEINVGGNVRAPLVGDFRLRSDGRELLVMVNHLYRTNEARRHEQARLLNQWARGQSLPVVALGDFNFDWEVEGGEARHDAGYDLMTAEGVWRWVRPQRLVKTQCSEQFDSVLDFVFVAGPARDWSASSEILNPEPSYCPDDSQQSDHRPVRARFFL